MPEMKQKQFNTIEEVRDTLYKWGRRSDDAYFKHYNTNTTVNILYIGRQKILVRNVVGEEDAIDPRDIVYVYEEPFPEVKLNQVWRRSGETRGFAVIGMCFGAYTHYNLLSISNGVLTTGAFFDENSGSLTDLALKMRESNFVLTGDKVKIV